MTSSTVQPNKLFFVILTYKVPLSIIDELRESHISYLDEYYKKGVFITSGPQVPREGGIILAQAEDKPTLLKILKHDPFHQHQAAEYKLIQFTPTKAHTAFPQFKEYIG